MNELVDQLLLLLEPVRQSPLLPLWVLLTFVVFGALFLPIWVLIFQVGLLVPPPQSIALVYAGAWLSATTFYGVGRLGRARIERRLQHNKVYRGLRGARIEHVMALRLLPVLPFTLINLSCGALGMRYRTFIGGTLFGMTPGILGVTLLGDRAMAVVREPTPASVATLGIGALLFVGLVSALRRFASRRVPDARASDDAPL